jgi:hypothetical protein
MKKRSLAALLQQLDDLQATADAGLTSLNDELSKQMQKGGYTDYNSSCSGSNGFCVNGFCGQTTNQTCSNGTC